jgi:glycosyltransferase involved in cell wall biosynthesis
VKILLLTRYSALGASSRLRAYQFIPFLTSHGINVTISPLLGDDYLKKFYSTIKIDWWKIVSEYLKRTYALIKYYEFDLLWIEKELFPFLPAFAEVFFNILKMPYIVDYDDAIFHNYDQNRNFFVRFSMAGKIATVMRRATIVIVGNEYLASYARMAGANRIELIPTVVDLNIYNVKEQPKKEVFTIGWIGTPVTVKYLELIRSVFLEWAKNKSAHLVIIGADSYRTDDIPIEYFTWSKDTEVSDIQKFDVGIMPLNNSPWERGKCGYKLIQYMACGIPVIASPVGVNSTIVEHGVNGFLANDQREWIEAIDILYNNPEQRAKMGQAGRKKVEEQYSLHVTGPKLLSMLHTIKNI